MNRSTATLAAAETASCPANEPTPDERWRRLAGLNALGAVALVALLALAVAWWRFKSFDLRLIAAGLIVAWALLPAIIVQYWRIAVPRRLREICDLFLHDEKSSVDDRRGRSAAWHYAKLLDPDDPVNDPHQRFNQEFWYFHDWDRYALPLLVVMLLSGFMYVFTGFWLENHLGMLEAGPEASLLARVKPTFVMALWGALVWSLYEVLSRRQTGDLTPAQLYEIAWRLVAAIPIGYAFSLLVTDNIAGLAAFAVSAFPFRDTRQLIRKLILQKVKDAPTTTTAAANAAFEGRISQTISGMSDETVVRLEELGIVTYQDLAYADPIKLMIKTGVPLRLVLVWIDKALLAVYASPHLNKLLQLGFPCALDACEFYVAHCYEVREEKDRKWREDPAVKELAAALQIPAESLVKRNLRAIFEDPHTQFLIRAWYGPMTAEHTM